MKTIEYFKEQKLKTTNLLKRLKIFVEKGELFGIADDELLNKLNRAISDSENRKLKVALIGGFSQGKTSIAAAWLETYDKESMKISAAESTDEINIYEYDDDVMLVDTPGLFGFKEDSNEKRFRDKTKNYLTEADLILYVMDPENPIKESHRDLFDWLFKRLDLLSRTIFVINMFDAVCDIEDEEDYEDMLDIKRRDILRRLAEFGVIEDNMSVPIVAVSSDPMQKGIEKYWLNHIKEYRTLSHIGDLQAATFNTMQQFSDKNEIVVKKQKSIIRDVIGDKLPTVNRNLSIANTELIKLQESFEDIEDGFQKQRSKLYRARTDLRNYVTEYYTDLIQRLKRTTPDTIEDFFDGNIGKDGILIENTIRGEIESKLDTLSADLEGLNQGINMTVEHYTNVVGKLAEEGVRKSANYLKNIGIQVTNKQVLAFRDLLLPSLKFKPYGAIKVADKITKGFSIFGAALGIGLDVWDSYSDMKKKEEFEKAIQNIVSQLEEQRQEYYELFNDNDRFVEKCVPEFGQLEDQIKSLDKQIEDRKKYINDFEEWKAEGEAIDVAFQVLNN